MEVSETTGIDSVLLIVEASLGSETTSFSSISFFFFFFSPSPALTASVMNLDSESVRRPSWIAARSSTAEAVEVKRWIAWTLSLVCQYDYATRNARKDVRLVGTLGRLKLLPEVFVVELGVVAHLEHDEADSGLSKDEHGVGVY